MYKIYWTEQQIIPRSVDVEELQEALNKAESLRNKFGVSFVTIVSDYAGMVGKPGAKGAGTEYVPQLKN